MSVEPPIRQALWDKTPPEVQAAVLALVHSLERRITTLEARLGQDSSNSSRPPSTDPPHIKRPPPVPASKKKRGGQRGHARQTRPLVAPEQLSGSFECKPTACGECGHTFDGVAPDPQPLRHQVAEIPEIRPDVVEYRLHRLGCPRCGVATRGELPRGVPRGAFGPRLQATVALLGGAYRLSKRRIVAMLADLLGLRISTGMICKAERACSEALAPTAEAIYDHVKHAPAAGVDETGWKQGGKRAWLWAAVTAGATAFRIAATRGADALYALVGDPVGPVITCDRYSTYAKAPDRQTCWAHLRRDFQSMIDRGAGGQEVGARLLRSSRFVFAWWRRHESGSVHRQPLRGYVAGLRPVVRLHLEAGAACSCAWTARVCRRLLATEATLWRFASAGGVPPHNNAAERALRHGVIWRKTSFGTDSEAGSRFVERMLTAVETCRQRGRGVRDFLVDCLRAKLNGTHAPPILT
jgi:transposase